MAEFKIPPVSTLLGSTFANYFRVINSGRIDLKYYHKVFLTGLICIIASPFHLWEKYKDRKLTYKTTSPIFIIGHWRSGTTILHNLLCQDPNSAYVTTYQSVFPNNMYSKLLFKPFMRWKIPEKRPSDNVALHVDYPQEDEFALSNMLPSFYEFFYFPEDYKSLYVETVLFENSSNKELLAWQGAYKQLIAKAKNNTQGKNIILKNPVNTARIDKILELFPSARFIHIYRNPIVVYLSTKKFFLSLFPTLQLQKTTSEQIIDLIFDLYARIMQAYFDQKELIPKGHLIEIPFESFEKDPIKYISEIYTQLGIDDLDFTIAYFKHYLEELGDYKKNVYNISQDELDRIKTEWSFAFEKLNYEIPIGLEII